MVRRNLCVGFACLLVVGLAVFGGMSWRAWEEGDQIGVLAAAVAVLVSLVSAGSALGITFLTTGTEHALSGLFLGILLRSCIPMGAAILLTETSPPLRGAGLFGTMVISYVTLLAVETFWAVRVVQAIHSRSVVA